MARNITFTDRAGQQYLWWQDNDPAVARRLNALLRECQRTPFTGTGKPEALKSDLRGFWSRRITQADRLVYRADSSSVEVVMCRFHYGDR